MKQSLLQTFAIPLLLLLVSIASLVLGLIAEGIWDWIAIAGLAVPLIAIWRALMPESSKRKRR
jgi:hypothetical protein